MPFVSGNRVRAFRLLLPLQVLFNDFLQKNVYDVIIKVINMHFYIDNISIIVIIFMTINDCEVEFPFNMIY